jgi:anti-sigma regulatory factor (Ser/Thr protein kinase)
MRGPQRFPAVFDAATVDQIRQSVNLSLAQAGIFDPFAYSLVTVADEICCNVLEHGGAAWVEVDVQPGPELVRIVVKDDGREFDPMAGAEAAKNLDDRTAVVRKLGLYMVGQLSHYCHYRRVDGLQNELTFEIKREAGA